MKYDAPRVTRFGTFRDLTLVGAAGTGDVIHGGATGCTVASAADCVRVS